AFTEIIPLVPDLLDVAVPVQGIETVFPDSAIGVAQHVDPDRARMSRVLGRNGLRKAGLSSLCHEDPVGRFREDTGVAAEGEAGVREGLVPAAHHLVRARANRTQLYLLCGDRRG